MRFVHAADLHLGTRRWLTTPPSSRELARCVRDADRLALSALVDLCLSEGAKMLLCAGDVIDGWCRDYRVALRFQREMLRLRDADCKVVLLLGNHDLRSRFLKALLLPGYARVIGLRGPETFDFPELGLAVHGWSAPSFPYDTPADGIDVAAHYPPPLPDRVNLGLLHTSAEGQRGHEDYAPCSRRTLRRHGYQYWALGHVHQRQVIARDPWIVFPGNLQSRGFREEGSKGAMVVEIADGQIRHVQHHPTDVLRFEVVHVQGDGVRHLGELWQRAHGALTDLKARSQRPTIARLVVHGVDAAASLLSAPPSERQSGLRELRRECCDETLWLELLSVQPTDDVSTMSLAA